MYVEQSKKSDETAYDSLQRFSNTICHHELLSPIQFIAEKRKENKKNIKATTYTEYGNESMQIWSLMIVSWNSYFLMKVLTNDIRQKIIRDDVRGAVEEIWQDRIRHLVAFLKYALPSWAVIPNLIHRRDNNDNSNTINTKNTQCTHQSKLSSKTEKMMNLKKK